MARIFAAQPLTVQTFNEFYQKLTATAPMFSVPTKTGPDHAPTVTVSVGTEWGQFTAKGSNQREARQKAVEMAYESYLKNR
jgi:dsRNA-specific ribonuclease